MKQNKESTIPGGGRRFRPAFVAMVTIMLFILLVIDTQKPKLIVPGIFHRAHNTSNYLLKMRISNYFKNKSLNISPFSSNIYNKLTNSTKHYPRFLSVYSGPVSRTVHKITKQPNMDCETSHNQTLVRQEHNQRNYVNRRNDDEKDLKTVEKMKDNTFPTRAMTNDINKSSTTVTGFGTARINNQTKNPVINQTCTQEFKSRHLMTVSIMGRTGNQLFEVCTLIATADDACYTPFVPSSINVGIETIFDIGNVIKKDVNMRTSNFKTIGERGWAIYNVPVTQSIDPSRNVSLSGYFQTFKHFHHKKKLIQSALVFREEIVFDVLNFFTDRSLQNKTKIGMHVRRGDFLKTSNIKLGYFAANKTFISKVIEYFTFTMPNQELAFIIVSDNITWCEENIKHKHVWFSPFKDAGRDLYILTQSDHNVVTSGTFGWMGAWLNETGTVVYDKSYPKYKSWLWWGHRRHDYYPPWWIGL